MGIFSTLATLIVPEQKSLPAAAVVPSWEIGTPQYARQTQSFERLAGQGYMADEVVFACVNVTATSASEPHFAAWKNTTSGDEKIPDHPSLQPIEHPNQFLDGSSMWQFVLMDMGIAGNAYLEVVRSGAGKPVEYWLMRPDRVRVIPDPKTHIGGYEYRIGDFQTVLPPEDVIHFKYPNPLDDFYGLSPLHVLAGRVDLDVWQRQFTEAFYRNAGVPVGLLNIKRQVSDQERELLKQRYRQQYAGPHGWGNLLVLDGGEAEYSPMTMQGPFSGIETLDEINEARICQAFGVPPSVISTRVGMHSSSYANRQEDFTIFWKSTLAPIYRYLGAVMTLKLKDDYPDVDHWSHDLSTIQALQEDTDKLFQRWGQALNMGLASRKEARVKVGLPEVPEDTDDVFYISTRLVPTPVDWDPEDVPAQAPKLPTSPPNYEQLPGGDSASQQALTEQQRSELLPGDGQPARRLPAGAAAPKPGQQNGRAH